MRLNNKISILIILLCLSINCLAQPAEYDNHVAAAWSVVIPGGGHFYKQNYSDGMLFFVSETISGLAALALLTAEAPQGSDDVNSGVLVAKVLGTISLTFFVPIKIVDIASAAGCVEVVEEETTSEIKLYPVYSLTHNHIGLTLSYNF